MSEMSEIQDDNPDEPASDTPDLPRRKWSGRRIVLIALPALLVGIGGAVFWKMESKKASAHVSESAKTGPATPYYVDMPDMLVNLSAPGGRSRYLKLSLTLQVDSAEHVKQLEAQMPRLRNSFLVFLRELRSEDLSGSAGLFFVKEELMRRVNADMAPLEVDDILFREMLQQ